MPHVTVRLFAALRERVPPVDAQGDTVGDVVEALSARFGDRFAGVARVGSAVVDGERADASTPLAEGQEMALLPPCRGAIGEGDRP